jgi:poly[(R)-3-hydroxyalkanoate] polymerase subunit PhaC
VTIDAKTLQSGAVDDVTERAAEAAGAADGALGVNPLAANSGAEVVAALQQITLQAVSHPWSAAQQYLGFAGAVARAWLGESALAPEPGDKRFTDPTWKDNPFYRTWLQTYLASCDALDGFIGSAGLSGKETQRARFALSLLTDALAPTNTLLGNPAAIKRLYETSGDSVVRGLMHLLEDIMQNRGMPAQVDKTRFQVGSNLAVSPGAVVFRNPVLELIQYRPNTETVYARPALVVPPQINKFYVLDLAPGRSVVEYLVNGGLQPFMVSWRNPTPAQRDWDLETYLQALLEALDAIREITGSADINMVGICAGGLATALLLGHLAARGDRRVNAASLVVTALDTGAESQVGLLATRQALEVARLTSRLMGVLDGRELGRVFAWLRPNDLVWNYWVNNYLLGKDPPAFDILYWNNDTTDLPAALHSDFLDMYIGSSLRKRGALELLGTPIDLSAVDLDTYIVAGITDHITPWKASYATIQLLGGQCEFILSSSGHVQSLVNPPGNPKAKFFRNARLAPDPDEWLAGAQQHTGSWWEHWLRWLGERSGEWKTAPKALGSRRHPRIEKAPGSCVLAQS